MSSCDLPVMSKDRWGSWLGFRIKGHDNMCQLIDLDACCHEKYHILSLIICFYVRPRHMCDCQFFLKKQHFGNFDSCLSPKIFIIIPWWFCLRLDKDIQHKTIHIKSALLANLSILELRDMMAFVITRGWWRMLSWEILYFPHIQVTVALGNILSSKRHYIEEYCKLWKALFRGIL